MNVDRDWNSGTCPDLSTKKRKAIEGDARATLLTRSNMCIVHFNPAAVDVVSLHARGFSQPFYIVDTIDITT